MVVYACPGARRTPSSSISAPNLQVAGLSLGDLFTYRPTEYKSPGADSRMEANREWVRSQLMRMTAIPTPAAKGTTSGQPTSGNIAHDAAGLTVDTTPQEVSILNAFYDDGMTTGYAKKKIAAACKATGLSEERVMSWIGNERSRRKAGGKRKGGGPYRKKKGPRHLSGWNLFQTENPPPATLALDKRGAWWSEEWKKVDQSQYNRRAKEIRQNPKSPLAIALRKEYLLRKLTDFHVELEKLGYEGLTILTEEGEDKDLRLGTKAGRNFFGKKPTTTRKFVSQFHQFVNNVKKKANKVSTSGMPTVVTSAATSAVPTATSVIPPAGVLQQVTSAATSVVPPAGVLQQVTSAATSVVPPASVLQQVTSAATSVVPPAGVLQQVTSAATSVVPPASVLQQVTSAATSIVPPAGVLQQVTSAATSVIPPAGVPTPVTSAATPVVPAASVHTQVASSATSVVPTVSMLTQATTPAMPMVPTPSCPTIPFEVPISELSLDMVSTGTLQVTSGMDFQTSGEVVLEHLPAAAALQQGLLLAQKEQERRQAARRSEKTRGKKAISTASGLAVNDDIRRLYNTTAGEMQWYTGKIKKITKDGVHIVKFAGERRQKHIPEAEVLRCIKEKTLEIVDMESTSDQQMDTE